MSKSCAVIQFPGSNCEYETIAAIEAAGCSVDLLRWNCNEDDFFKYHAFILPGGFSFQDRIRAGVVASKLPIMTYLKKADQSGLPILGICNGCQILAETGIVPNVEDTDNIEMALAPNMKQNNPHGFVCDWVYVKIKQPEKNIFTKTFSETDVIPIQINHAEGNFNLAEAIKSNRNNLTEIYYVNDQGEKNNLYPINPNGTYDNLAGISNKKGNALAMMPHPERAFLLTQMPQYLNHEWSSQKRLQLTNKNQKGPWSKLFEALSDYLQEDK
ncbi:phosphoribosylformylglycinamidine synthase I [Candidatus Marinamargulisbacteria bacterium SCGC AG-414-C22]|nr:phosphoribosylformylglycinamidine synthase I [Candidatus Marinamargulisbacteria bacterium SCGC AG-414-C22]